MVAPQTFPRRLDASLRHLQRIVEQTASQRSELRRGRGKVARGFASAAVSPHSRCGRPRVHAEKSSPPKTDDDGRSGGGGGGRWRAITALMRGEETDARAGATAAAVIRGRTALSPPRPGRHLESRAQLVSARRCRRGPTATNRERGHAALLQDPLSMPRAACAGDPEGRRMRARPSPPARMHAPGCRPRSRGPPRQCTWRRGRRPPCSPRWRPRRRPHPARGSVVAGRARGGGEPPARPPARASDRPRYLQAEQAAADAEGDRQPLPHPVDDVEHLILRGVAR